MRLILTRITVVTSSTAYTASLFFKRPDGSIFNWTNSVAANATAASVLADLVAKLTDNGFLTAYDTVAGSILLLSRMEDNAVDASTVVTDADGSSNTTVARLMLANFEPKAVESWLVAEAEPKTSTMLMLALSAGAFGYALGRP